MLALGGALLEPQPAPDDHGEPQQGDVDQHEAEDLLVRPFDRYRPPEFVAGAHEEADFQLKIELAGGSIGRRRLAGLQLARRADDRGCS